MTTTPAPEQGQIVQARSRPWVVNVVKPSNLPTLTMKSPLGRTQNLLTLSSVEGDGLGEELQVVWEIEPGAKIIERVALLNPTDFDSPDKLDAFLDAVRWGAASTADHKNIQSPFRSGIEIEDYQLDPVVRAIQMPRVNLLIADDVGLGKTIEAGMVGLELIIRHRARKILVVCPSALQIQWRDQMRDKFGLDFRIVDSSLMRELRRRRGIHVNPWAHFPRLITSIDFLKRERPLRLIRETLPAPGEPIYPRKYDLLIVDEAHNCAPSGVGQYSADSLRTQALRELAPHFEHKLFLTATPHNGYRESFSALLELLDNQRFSRGTEPDRKQLEAVMVRRLKSDPSFAFNHLGIRRFPPRILEPIEVPYTDEEREIHAALRQYTKLRSSRAEDNAERFATEFVLKTLKKRLFSCPAAFLTTLEQHENSLNTAKRKVAKPTYKTLQLELDRMDEEYADDGDYDEATAGALDTATRLFAKPTADEEALLQKMKDWAKRARGQRDSKVKQFVAWLKEHLKPGGKWSNERVIIFTEYRATQNWLQEVLSVEGFTDGDRLLTMYGGMDSEKREEVKASFQTSPEVSPVRILLATDAASEGLDFQNFCSRLIHYEIPWNPNRMEQRNGRVDRHGQKADKVQVFHFVGKGYKDRATRNFNGTVSDMEADLEFLMRVALKIETIREDLGKVGTVIAEQVEEAMLGQRTKLDTAKAEKEAEPIRKMLRFERDLQKQVQALMEQYRETRKELRLSPDNIRQVVSVGLMLAGQPALMPTKTDGQSCFHLPPLKGSWAACAEGLEHPHTKDIRPITFDESVSRGRDNVVLVHLNHRLPQMCLRLLRAEVWAEKGRSKLQRVTARVVPNDVLDTPAVIAHARLVVIGGDSFRLHEEIIATGGFIKDQKWGTRLNVGQTESALAGDTAKEPSAAVKAKLLELYPSLTSSLASALEARMKQMVDGLQKKLSDRAEKEAKDITSILTELKKSIEAELKDPDYLQPSLPGMTAQEEEQFSRNKDAMRARAREIPEEIKRGDGVDPGTIRKPTGPHVPRRRDVLGPRKDGVTVMDLPIDYTRPFFSYGLFQPGQIGFHSLRPHVSRYEQGWSLKGKLLQRDGLPVLLLDGNEKQCPGSVIHFLPGQEAHAYPVIARIEPDKLYKWAEKEAHQLEDGRSVAVNVLEGVKVNRGTHPMEEALWDGKNEPLFSSALEVVQETMEQSKTFDWDLKSLFRLQMAYMLLWTSIERYASFRYHLGDRVMDKLKGLSQNPDFGKALRDVVTESRVIYRSDDPDKKETLDANNPRKALDYYFQVRSNITHRGKAALRDHKTLVKSVEELLNIFRRVLDAEFRID